jgi:predicted PhzF superfamily epimerase YddE/YHI9
MIADLDFAGHATVASDVLWNEVEGELVLLDLNSEKYFGLDETGTAIWKAVTRAPTIEDAYQELSAIYEVEREELRADLKSLLQELIDRGLLEIRPSRP